MVLFDRVADLDSTAMITVYMKETGVVRVKPLQVLWAKVCRRYPYGS